MSSSLLPGKVSALQTSKSGLTYLLYLPPSFSPTSPSPNSALLFLHGAGGVNDPSNVLGQSLLNILSTESTPTSLSALHSHVVVAPIAPSRGWQGHFPQVLDLLSDLRSDLNLQSKVHLAGQSMGGNGAWSLATERPDLVKSLTTVCGYVEGNRSGDTPLQFPPSFSLSSLLPLPTWVFHGSDDTIVPVAASDSIVTALKAAGSSVKYTRYAPGLSPPCKTPSKDLAGHGSYELAFREEEWWKWLESV